MTRPSPFRQRDVTKAIRAAAKGGVQIGRVEVAQDGRIVLIADKQEPTRLVENDPPNSWEGV